MAKNKIITSEGNIQFQFPDGKILNIDPKNVYSVYNTNTVNFILISAMKNSGLAFMSSTAEDLELNGQTYTFAQLPDAIAEAFSDAGASFHAEVVDELPASGKSNTIYLVPKESSASTEIDEFDEYIWLKDEQEWEMIGTTSIDMSNINALSGQVQTLSGEVITLSGEVSANTANISTLSGDVASISGDVSSISGDVQSLSGDIASISGDVATVSGQVSANTANISALSGDVNSLSGEVQTISGDVQSLSGDIASISGDVATVSGSVSSLSGEVVTLSGEVSANTANISTLSGNVATVSGQVDAVSGQVSSLSGSVIENEEITAAALNQLNDDVLAVSAATSGKVDLSSVVSSVTSASTDSEIPTAKAVFDAIPTGGTSITIDPTLNSGSTNPVANSAITDAFNNVANIRQNNDSMHVRWYDVRDYNGTFKFSIYNFSINGRMPLSRQNATDSNVDNFSLVETSAITSAMTSGSTHSEVPSAKAVYDKFDGLKLKKITQDDYDTLTTKDSQTLYIITDS